MESIRKAELTLAISYDTDIRQAKEIITGIMAANPKVLKDPQPVVVVRELNAQSIILAVRPWSTNDDFATMPSEILEACKAAFDKAGLSIQPYNVEVSRS